jgi:acyl-CoA synthetase (AMP-forming)/AMP-acid ligase II
MPATMRPAVPGADGGHESPGAPSAELPPSEGPGQAPAAAAARFERHLPDGVVVRRREAIRYRDLDTWSSRIADRLTRLGARDGSRVLVSAEPTVAALAAILGVQRSGAQPAPIEAEAATDGPRPAERASGRVAAVAVAEGAAARRLADEGFVVVRADECYRDAD